MNLIITFLKPCITEPTFTFIHLCKRYSVGAKCFNFQHAEKLMCISHMAVFSCWKESIEDIGKCFGLLWA